ncbi:hypothetical protein HW555_006035 [Spodoptera exigua]|uniref:DUF4771 domain-containing protein n=1 Tax=Spodoptera exigua TaxID=7107 RepID=A0A835LAJ4_SPOEX|nr:hypothetical protein HW555_006035 [Spodoptera exigua]
MVESKYGPETTHDEKVRRRLQVVYARQTREKQIFMEELKEYRRRKDKQRLQSIIVAIGPRWYQALSVPQRKALDSLKDSIYQDILEGRPERSSVVMHKLGLFPRPSTAELMSCLYAGSVTLLPAEGEFIHGGYSAVNGQYITLHCGFRGWPPARKTIPCDCLKKWHDTVFQYVKDHKCHCGHYYDYGNEGAFPPDQLPYFDKPTRHAPFQFNYQRIYDLDPKRLYIEKEFNKVWETDKTDNTLTDEKKQAPGDDEDKLNRKIKISTTDTVQKTISIAEDVKKTRIVGTVDGRRESKMDPETLKKFRKSARKASKKTLASDGGTSKRSKSANWKASNTCLGLNPKPQDYLKCALRQMRKMNVAARLPDLHLVPELKEWMRRRLYGSLTVQEKKEYLRKSTTYWRMFTTLAEKGFGHVATPKEPMYLGHTTWYHKQNLNDNFRHYTQRYKLSMFRSHAYVTNLLWRTMYQAEFPDKNFREIYFSYLFSRIEDLQLIHPYCSRESEERKLLMAKKRYICLPAGYEPKQM